MNTNPIERVKAEFIERKTRNPQYSLRSFARDLNISAGHLSRVFNGQRNLTRVQAARIAAAMNLSKRESEKFIQNAILEAPANARVSKALRERTLKSVKKKTSEAQMVNNLSMDRFKAISRWYHIPLLELTYLDSFKADESWIAKQLGITTIEAKDAVQRLTSLGLLEACPKRGLKKTNQRLFIDSQSEPEMRKFQRSMIEKTLPVLDQASAEEMKLALINSITFPVSRKLIPELREEIFEFQKRILKLIQNQKFEEVYQLNCQLIPLTQKAKK